MKKIFTYILLVAISLIYIVNVNALNTAEATEAIDVSKKAKLTINYLYEDYNFDNIDIKIYHIANVSSDFKYELTSDFLSYPVVINGLKTPEDLDILEQTLDAYIEADNINALQSISVKENRYTLNDLKPGLYYVKASTIETEKYILVFDSFLINVPELNSNGTWNYDITVYPKAESYIPIYEDIEYSVLKTWKDSNKNRPRLVEIEIYKDGQFVEKKILSKNNNWMYKWVTKDDGSVWKVVERNVPNRYSVTISTSNRTQINIVNTSNEYDNPDTNDEINSYFYTLLISSGAIALILLNLLVRRKNV